MASSVRTQAQVHPDSDEATLRRVVVEALASSGISMTDTHAVSILSSVLSKCAYQVPDLLTAVQTVLLPNPSQTFTDMRVLGQSAAKAAGRRGKFHSARESPTCITILFFQGVRLQTRRTSAQHWLKCPLGLNRCTRLQLLLAECSTLYPKQSATNSAFISGKQ